MILSDTAEYALRAVLYVGRTATAGRPTQTEEISSALGLPRNYLSKILHALTRRGILRSARGPAGGFALAVDPRELPLVRVVELFDEVEPRRTCLLGRPECSDVNPCPAHSRWKAIGDQVRGFFWDTTVADLLGERGTLA
jgi:Rrf2 family protein